MSYDGYEKHYPSGEPGTHGREPFDEGSNDGPGLSDTTNTVPTGAGVGSSGLTGGPTGGVGSAMDAHGGTIARDTGKRGDEVVGLGGPKESSSGAGSTGGALGAGATGAGAGLAGSTVGQNFGEEHSSVRGGNSSGTAPDRTGNLDQEAHKYEATGSGGPTTSGAANTDKFDTNPRPGAGAGVTSPPTVEQDDSHRKGTGGIGGILGTTDKEFTANPSRTGQGAYHDSDGRYQTNTSGPAGNTALTGREGTAENNPVAQAQSRSQGGDNATGEKKGLMDKVKDVFK